jgi:hypothetical protein
MERKWKDRKLWKSINEFGLELAQVQSLIFVIFFFHFLSIKPNGPNIQNYLSFLKNVSKIS